MEKMGEGASHIGRASNSYCVGVLSLSLEREALRGALERGN